MYLFGRSLRAVAASATLGAGFVGATIQNEKPKVTDLTAKKQDPSLKLPSNDGFTDQRAKHSNSWSSAVTAFRSTKHTHSWTIRNFSQCQCKYKETVFKPISSLPNDASPTFRIRVLPVVQNMVRVQVASEDPRAKFLAKLTVYNSRNEKIGTKIYPNYQRPDHIEDIPRDMLLSQIGPEDELRIEVDLIITRDTTVIESSVAKPSAITEQPVDPKLPNAAPFLRRTALVNVSQSDTPDTTQYTEVALLDTGSTISMIKPSAAQAFQPWQKTTGPPAMCGFGGGCVAVQGEVFLDVRIGDSMVRKQQFLVMDLKLSMDMLLGTDFQDAVGSITFDKDGMKVNGQDVHYASDKYSAQSPQSTANSQDAKQEARK